MHLLEYMMKKEWAESRKKSIQRNKASLELTEMQFEPLFWGEASIIMMLKTLNAPMKIFPQMLPQKSFNFTSNAKLQLPRSKYGK